MAKIKATPCKYCLGYGRQANNVICTPCAGMGVEGGYNIKKAQAKGIRARNKNKGKGNK